MKNILLSSLASLTVGTVSAQASMPAVTPLQVACFTVDDTRYYDITGCVPGSEAAFYSRPDGGELLRSALADGAGHLQAKGDSHFRPAFVINEKLSAKCSTHGSGIVSFTAAPEFELRGLKAVVQEGRTSLSWEATVATSKDLWFVVERSADGSSYAAAGKVAGTSLKATYAFQEALPGAVGAYYRLAVLSKDGMRRYYTTSPEWLGGPGVTIYPTRTSGDIIIALPAGNETAKYRVCNSEGKQMLSATLPARQNRVDLSSLPAGIYLVTVQVNAGPVTMRIVRE